MKTALLLAGLCAAALGTYSLASAQERHEEHREAPVRNAPPKFQPHPPGMHPHGPIVRPHPVRTLSPKVVVRGRPPAWPRWSHPEFARPLYYWDWPAVHGVSCVAEDSYGDQYPVSQTTWAGFGLPDMTAAEDDALDRCYAESGQDPSCFLTGCSYN